MQKPILPIWYQIKNLKVETRTQQLLGTEIYKLSDDSYLYLFLDIGEWDILETKSKQENLLNLGVGKKTYIWIISKEFRPDQIGKIKTDLTQTLWFDSIAWMHKLKDTLMNEVILPITEPEKYKKYKLSIPNWILLFWPPWCWKTFISRKLAEELWYHFIEIKHSDISSPYIHGTVWMIWDAFAEARKNKPCIVFIDEISGLVPKREWVGWQQFHKEEEVNELLMQLNDAWKNQVLVIWATNFPDRIDSAVLRSGRMDKRIYIWPPDNEARVQLFKMYLGWRPLWEINYDMLAEKTENFVTADIEVICGNSARKALASNSVINDEICLEIIWSFKSSISKEDIARYESLIDNFERW